MLVVDPGARGRGAGPGLHQRARAAGARELRLSTEPEMHAAQRLYQRLGFARTPEHDWTPLAGVLLLSYTLPLG